MRGAYSQTSCFFGDDASVMGDFDSDLSVPKSCYTSLDGLNCVVLVPYSNDATIGMTTNFRTQLGPKFVASSASVIEFYESQLPSFKGLVLVRKRELNVAVSEPSKLERTRPFIRSFLNEIYSLSQIGNTDAAGLKIYDFLDRLLIDGYFTVCDEILSKVNIAKLDTKLMDSFLTITARAKKKLPARAALFKEIEAKMIALRGPERTRKILSGLA